jgi:putative OPT family oligopeptide transporter
MADDPYIPADQNLPEFTVKAIVVGVVLAIIMGAANAYLGLKVGMTVSATIPSAVMAMAIFRSIKGNVLEVNLAKTMGSAGESLAAGVIFTIPALIILGAWVEIDYFVTTAVALLGGMMGVFFTVPLRRILVVEEDLPYPEGVACTEVVLAGEEGGNTAKLVFSALFIGGVYKFISSGLNIMHDKIASIISVGKAKFFGGGELSAALLGIGYIIGPRIASFVFLGGILGWVLITPIFLTMAANGTYPIPEGSTLMEALEIIRLEQVVWVGIGAITTGGIYTLITLKDSMKSAFGKIRAKKSEEDEAIRTERDLPVDKTFIAVAALVIPIFGLFYYLSESGIIAGVSAIVAVITAFFFTAVAGYLAGVVGSSNNPISGVTITTLLFTSLLLLAMGARGEYGMTTALGVGAVICCAAAIAGDVMQDFKTGQLLGSTPKALQMGEMIAVLAMAMVIAPILMLLHNAYTIGGPELPAPQATVMAGLLNAMFGEGMNFMMFLLGVELAIFLILLDLPILPVAIGIYLPFPLTTPIMLGGVLNAIVTKIGKRKPDMSEEKIHSRGVLFSSGLVAGEALLGIVIAGLYGAFTMERVRLLKEPLPFIGTIVFFGMAFLLLRTSLVGIGASMRDVPKAIKELLWDLKMQAIKYRKQ